MPWATPTDFVAGVVVTEANLDLLSSILTTGVTRPLAESILVGPAGSIDFASIPATFRSLAICLTGRTDGASNFLCRFNNDSGASQYTWEVGAALGTVVSGCVPTENLASSSMLIGNVAFNTSTAGAVGSYFLVIPMYAQTVFHKTLLAFGGYRRLTTTGEIGVNTSFGLWQSTAAINRVTILPASGNFVAGSGATLLGLPF